MLSPVVYLINFVSKIFLKNIIIKSESTLNEESEEELDGIIHLYKTSNPDSEHEKEMLQSILTLNDTAVEEVFTHRKNIFSINADLDLNTIIENINKSNFTRIPFWKKIRKTLLVYLIKEFLILILIKIWIVKTLFLNV